MTNPASADPVALFSGFAMRASETDPLRTAITGAYRRNERACIADLLPLAVLPADVRTRASALATALATQLRAQPAPSGVEALVHEYALSSQEGIALMCLAEALLRIPDTPTRDALIRDKIAKGDWQSHLGKGRPLFVNAATWGLALTGKLAASIDDVGSIDDRGLGAALTRAIARAGEPVIRRGVDIAMRLMGEHFVMGETIGKATARARSMEQRGFLYSYDMLGEAALTEADAARYIASYEAAIHAIGAIADASGGATGKARDPVTAPGISVKLSALHPRYARGQRGRVMTELMPRVTMLALLARRYGIGFNIDAEEADRLDMSLDLLEGLALNPALRGWDGLGFVVQAYGRRCPFVIDWLVALGRRSGHRLMVRLVKGAYWDSEIKRAQVDGLADYPVFTRKVHTDLSYIACARKLLAAPDAVFPQFATHNAHTLATIYEMANAAAPFSPGQYEFQCLHGMGEPLYDLVVGPARLNRPCRIYAPVGTHETLLAYLVRRLLENGANSSFVNRIANPDVAIAELVEDPVAAVTTASDPGAPHPLIGLPRDIPGTRANSCGLDLSDEQELARLEQMLGSEAGRTWTAAPSLPVDTAPPRPIRNPARHYDIVGTVREATPDAVHAALHHAAIAAPLWAAIPAHERADRLERAAQHLQDRMARFIALIVREAGRSVPNAIGELREAIDFLRYYAQQARRLPEAARPLGPVACISPWNFPLAIFTGQIAAALAAGNVVLAKPAEETPLAAAAMIALMHGAGIPAEALQLLPGDGAIGAALVAAPQIAGVVFTGSTDAARSIQQTLAARLSPDGKPVPLIAETGGLNAMIVDSSALPEQVVADVLASAFDSAGQRCSALRVLCLQDDIADPVLAMLRGAMAELKIGPTDSLSNDIGPVISAEARSAIEAYIEEMAQRGHAIHRAVPAESTEGTGAGHFVAPTIIEVASPQDVHREVFGPVLHVLTFARDDLSGLIDAINAWGYGLTFGLHTRLDDTIARVTGAIKAGNIYVNRNMIGAVVGVQPFGGSGLSGTGPKAGGPLYLPRLLRNPQVAIAQCLPQTLPGQPEILPGPVGERNSYAVRSSNRILIRADDPAISSAIAARLTNAGFSVVSSGPCELAVVAGCAETILALQQELAALPGRVVPIHACRDASDLILPLLGDEQVISINTTAAGGNASLMAIA